MKRLYLSAVLITIAALTFCGAYADDNVAVNAANFPDANFRAYVSANCDTDGNGVLSTGEIASVTEIRVNGCSISD